MNSPEIILFRRSTCRTNVAGCSLAVRSVFPTRFSRAKGEPRYRIERADPPGYR
jgi:hypothetical protein